MSKLTKSLALWKEYGQYVLLATEYQDSVLARAGGCSVEDVDGNSFLDLEAGQICAILGHQNPVFLEKVVQQIKTLSHVGTGFLSEPVFEAAKKLADIVPGDLKRSIILSTGAEANECAFRIVKAYTGKRGIVGFDKGYSGLTLATSSVGGNSRDTSLAVAGAFKIITPDCRNCPIDKTFPECDIHCLKLSEQLLFSHCAGSVGCIIVEPILSAGGMVFPPSGYFKRLKSMARRAGALLIADEAQTGMGRTGRWFGLDHEDLTPDILVVSKGVGGGFPASAVVVSDEIANGILGKFSNFSSHQSDPMGAVAISAVIETIESEDLISNASKTGEYFVQSLQSLIDEHSFLKDVRGKGLMIGMNAVACPEKGLTAGEVGRIFAHLCRGMGVHLKTIHDGEIFRILPPLTISKQEIDTAVSVFDAALKQMATGTFDVRMTHQQNPEVRRMIAVSEGRLTVGSVMKKAWETPPKTMLSKIRDRLKKGED